jgi:nicotinamide-nucleotide amidase
MIKSKPTIAIVTIGDEILLGQITDTNSAWLADKLYHLGFHVDQICSISDNPEKLTEQLDILISKVDAHYDNRRSWANQR